MKKTPLLLILAALLAGQVKAQTSPETSKTKLETTVVQDFFDLYRMRGLNFSTGPVSQTNLIMNYGNLAGIVLVNHNFDRGHIDEYDFVARYTDTLNVNIAGAKPIVFGQFVYLDMARQQAGKSKEAAVVATLPISLNSKMTLTPTVTVAKDFDKGKGEYLGLGFSQDIAVDSASGIAANISGVVGYNNKYWNSTSTWSHADISARVSVPLGNGWTATPNITYSGSLNKEYFSNATVAGLQISKQF
jgi:hypothetical protein